MAIFPAFSKLWGRRILGRTQADPGNAKPGLAAKVLQGKIALMYGRLPAGLGMSLIVSTTLALSLTVQTGQRNLLLWGLANVILGVLRFADWLAFSREPQDLAGITRRRRNLVIAAASQGLLWGVLGWYLFPASPLEQLLLLLVMTGMAGVGILFLSPLQAAYAVYIIPVMLPVCLHLMGGTLALQRVVGCLGIVYIVAMLFTSARISRWIGESLGSAFENEELVRRLNATNAGLLQSMNEGFGQMDEHDNFLFANAAAETIFRVPPGTLAGRSLLDFLDADGVALVSQETEQRRMGKSNRYIHSIILEDGQRRLLQINATPTRDPEGGFTGTFAVFEDITELKQAETALLEREAQLRAIFESSQDAIGVARAGIQEMANPAFLSMFGFDRAEDLIGTPLIELIAPESRDRVLANIRARTRGESAPVAYEVVALRKNGSTFPMEMHLSTYGRDGITHTVASLRDITERKRAEEEVREANQFKEQIIRCVREGVIVHGLDLCYQVWNPFMEELSGLSESEVLGRHPTELFPFFRGAGVIERLERALAGESVESIDFPYHFLKTGKSGWANDNAAPFYDAKGKIVGVIVVVREITERKRAEATLRESEERYRTQFELSTEGILALSTGADIIDVNESFARMHGYTREEILRMKLEDLDTPESFKHAEARIRSILAGEEPTFEVEHRHKDGHAFPLEVSAGIITSGGRCIVLNYHRDITERKSAEREKEKLQAQLLHAQKMESLGVLAGGIAHDMNNVLGAILGMASAHLDDHPVGSPARHAFSTISNAANRGGKMVKTLLNFARKSPAEEREIDLNDLLREEVGLLERTTLSRIRLELDLAPSLRPIRGDASALTNAFMNIFVNAVDATADDGTLTIRTGNLGDDWIEVQVEDTGSGMPKDVLEKALDPFFTTKGMGKGTGLGLSMVYGTVKAHQGEMEIQSAPGRGTCVRIRFPACAPADRPSRVEPPPPPEKAKAGLKILLVDDDELIQGAMQAMLGALGHQVASAWTGEEALGMLDFHPDVVILDMNMPGLGGAATLARLRGLCPSLPVLLSTGKVDQAALDLVEAHPHVTLLSKPFSMGELKHHLEQLG